MLAHVLQRNQDLAWRFINPKIDADIWALYLHIFYPIQFVKPLDCTLCSSGFCGLGTKSFYESFLLADILLLIFVKSNQIFVVIRSIWESN
jgi:hypothetical protein